MSKNKIDRHPISENQGRAFMATVWTLTKAFGIDKIPAVCHYFQLAGEEIDRALFEQKHPAVNTHRESAERSRFIAIFKSRWLEVTDFEYDKAISPQEGKQIAQLCQQLTERGFVVDEYLKWLYEVFIVESPKFCPPQIKWACSNMCVHKFFYDNKDTMKQRKDEAIRSKQSVDLLNRARYCMRQSQPGEVEIIQNLIKKFSEGGIVIDDMRQKVEKYENALRARQSGVNNGSDQS
jgi:hypothetical protein